MAAHLLGAGIQVGEGGVTMEANNETPKLSLLAQALSFNGNELLLVVLQRQLEALHLAASYKAELRPAHNALAELLDEASRGV